MGPKRHQPLGPPVTLGATTGPEDFRELAAQEAALAKSALTNEARARHYAMAAYYTRLAEAKDNLERMTDPTDRSEA
jgi:hypothetical protein